MWEVSPCQFFPCLSVGCFSFGGDRLPSARLVRLSMRLERLESSMDERLRALEECEGEFGSYPGKKISAGVSRNSRC